jgi:hypothetical protein
MQLLTDLDTGRPLGELTHALGIKCPDELQAIILVIADTSYFVSPPIHLRARCDSSLNRLAERPLCSPDFGLSCWSVIATASTPEVLDLTSEDLLAHFAFFMRDAKLDFAATDSRRVGSFELLCVPLINEFSQSVVAMRVVDGCYQLELSLNEWTRPMLAISATFTLHQRGYLTRTETRRLQSNGTLLSAKFGIKEPASEESELQIVAHGSDGDILLLHRTLRHMRFEHVHVETHVMSRNEAPKISLPELDDARKIQAPRIASRVDKLENVAPVRHSKERSRARSWSVVQEEIQRRIRRLQAQTPAGVFLPRRFDGQDVGVVAFLEWFRSLSESFRTHRIMILDPYLDEFILRAITRCESLGVSWDLVMSAGLESESGPNRDQRMIKLIQDNAAHFRGRQLKITSLSRNNPKERVFHDRYVLVYDENGPVAGYTLSNSIQLATANHPLLIVRIPDALLGKVSAYATALTACATEIVGFQFRASSVFDSSIQTHRAILAPQVVRVHADQTILSLKRPSHFISILLQRPELRDVEAEKLVEILYGEKLLDATGSKFVGIDLVDRVRLKEVEVAEGDFTDFALDLARWLCIFGDQDSAEAALASEVHRTRLVKVFREQLSLLDDVHFDEDSSLWARVFLGLSFRADAQGVRNRLMNLSPEIRMSGSSWGWLMYCIARGSLRAWVDELDHACEIASEANEQLRYHHLAVMLASLEQIYEPADLQELSRLLFASHWECCRVLGLFLVVHHSLSFPRELFDALNNSERTLSAMSILGSSLSWEPDQERIDRAALLVIECLRDSELDSGETLEWLMKSCPFSWSVDNIIKPLQEGGGFSEVVIAEFLLARISRSVAGIFRGAGTWTISEGELQTFRVVASLSVKVLGIRATENFLQELENEAFHFVRDPRRRSRFYEEWSWRAYGLVYLVTFLMLVALSTEESDADVVAERIDRLLPSTELFCDELLMSASSAGRYFAEVRAEYTSHAR